MSGGGVRGDPARPVSRGALLRLAVPFVLAALAAAVWSLPAVRVHLDPQRFAAAVRPFLDAPHAPLLVLGAYVLGSLLVVPVTFLIVSTALLYGPFGGFALAFGGCLAGAALGYGLGAWLGHEAVCRLAGSRIERLSRRLAQRGIRTMAVVRLLPLAPFTIVNLAAGASHIRFADYMIGSALGLTPAILAFGLFADRLRAALREPDAASLGALAAVVLAMLIGSVWLRRRLERPVRANRPGAAAT